MANNILGDPRNERANKAARDVMESYRTVYAEYQVLGTGVIGVRYSRLHQSQTSFDFFFDGGFWYHSGPHRESIDVSGPDAGVLYFEGDKCKLPVADWKELQEWARKILVPRQEGLVWNETVVE